MVEKRFGNLKTHMELFSTDSVFAYSQSKFDQWIQVVFYLNNLSLYNSNAEYDPAHRIFSFDLTEEDRLFSNNVNLFYYIFFLNFF